MNKIRYYNSRELRILLNNPNVETIYNNSQIKYKNEFKLWAIKMKLSHKEFTARQIFEMAGFDMCVLDDRTPQRRLLSWIKKYKMFGEDYFTNKNKYTYVAKDKSINYTEWFLVRNTKAGIKVFPLKDIKVGNDDESNNNKS